MINPNTHFYLYAKHWYKPSQNQMDDLKVLMHEYSGTPLKYVSENDVYDRLMTLAWEEMNKTGNPEYQFRQFTSNVQRLGVTTACLNILALARAEGRNLGRPDFNLLSPFDDLAYENGKNDSYKWAEK